MLPKSLKKHSFFGFLSIFTKQKLESVYPKLISAIKRLFSILPSQRSGKSDLPQHQRIVEIFSERAFNTLVRKLDNKMWLDQEVSKTLDGTQADALKNFRTTDNKLSVFIADAQTDVPRILAAIAAGGGKTDKVDYAIFDAAILDRYHIQYERCPGDTPDEAVNDLHVDLTNLTASQICSLTKDIQSQGSLERLSRKTIENIINEGIDNGFLAKERVRAIRLKTDQVKP